MKNKIFTFLIFLLSASIAQAQLQVTVGMTPTQYVQNVLLGAGVTVSNVTFTGSTTAPTYQIGKFANGGTTNLGLDSGLIMSSGNVLDAPGPNNSSSTTSSIFPTNSDPDLTTMTGYQTNDAAILEFDFVPTGDSVKFQYVFGSEEYPEFVNSYNDGFGFFLSGPGIMGPYTNNAVNIALIPNTTTPVTINNVNNGNFYCPSSPSGPCTNCSYYINNCNGTPGTSIQYDGFTTVLTAAYPVQCGLTYHIKLAVADALDQAYDSAVMLKAGSFSSNQVGLSSNFSTSSNDSVIYEGCGVATIDFTRAPIPDTTTVYLYMTGTATDLVDYTNVPDSLTFYAGDDSLSLNISAFTDALTEGLESVTLHLVQVVCADTDTTAVTFYIQDLSPVTANVPNDSVICPGDSVTLTATISGGVAPYHILWNNGDSTTSIKVSPAATMTYYYVVSDSCPLTLDYNGSVQVYVPPFDPFLTTASNDTIKHCPNDSIILWAAATGGNQAYTYGWSGGLGNNDSIKVSPTTTTAYTVTVSDGCGNSDIHTITVTVPNFVALSGGITNNDTLVCPGTTLQLNSNYAGGVGSPTYNWSNGVTTASNNVTPLTTTTYYLTITDSCGAIVQDSVKINVGVWTGPLGITMSDQTKNCVYDTLTFRANVTGGVLPYTYSWNTGSTQDSITVSPTTTTTYTLTVKDSCGDSVVKQVTAIVTQYQPLAITTIGNQTLHCPGDSLTIWANVTGGSMPQYTYYWTNGDSTFTGKSHLFNFDTTTTFTVFVIDSCTMDSIKSTFTITVPPNNVLKMHISNDTTICYGESAKIGALAYNGFPEYMYQWNTGAETDSIIATGDASANYYVTATDQCGRKQSGKITVSVSRPTADFSYKYFPDGYTAKFYDASSNDVIKWLWIFTPTDSGNVENPTFTFIKSGNHDVKLIVTNALGCKDSVIKELVPPISIYVPNAFTPNGNNLNDIFTAKGIGIISFKMSIFNRWGQLLFQTDDINKGWNGIYDGRVVPVGVYVYKIFALGYSDQTVHKYGTVTVVR